MYPVHLALGARMGEFAGWAMPLWYRSAIEEHSAVRHVAGLFDVSHLSKFEIAGDGALPFLQYVTTSDVCRSRSGEAQYTLLCNQDGGIIDDAVVYRLPDRYWLVGNAGAMARTYHWLHSHLTPSVVVNNVTHEMAMLALQGPLAADLLKALLGQSLAHLPWFRSLSADVGAVRALVVRGGYTGEDGFELFCSSSDGVALWQTLRQCRIDGKVEACGLAARDILRLEAGLRLYGQDIDESVNPLEAGLGWVVNFDKGDFVGRAAILRARSHGVSKKLVGLLTEEGARVPRRGNSIMLGGVVVGRVTSGAFSPGLGRGIALGYVLTSSARVGTRLEIAVQRTSVAAEIVRLPFYCRPTTGQHLVV